MSGSVGPGRPTADSRFQQSEGAPQVEGAALAICFDVVIDRTLTVTQNGKAREVTVEEALQHRTCQDALAGNRAARREVLKMIAKREKWLAAKAPRHQPAEFLAEYVDPDNTNEALILLGIAEPDTRLKDLKDEYERLLLRPWAVRRR